MMQVAKLMKLVKLEDARSLLSFRKRRSRWSQRGDRIIKDFFDMVNPKRHVTSAKFLKIEDGEITCDLKEIKDIFTVYYSKLLAKSPHLCHHKNSKCLNDCSTYLSY